jgi:general secretion pathway protein G
MFSNDADKIVRQKGFSLTELMVVVMIMAIMSSFAMQYYSSTMENTRRTKAIQDLEGIKQAIKMYHLQSGNQYPPSIDALVGKYLSQAPVDPWGSAYKLDTQKLEVYCVVKKTGQRIALKYGRK